MPLSAIRIYLERLPMLLAEKQRMDFEASAFPYMDRSTQWSIMRRLEAYVAQAEVPLPRATAIDLQAIGIKDVRVQPR